MRSRVMPGSSPTIERRLLVSRLNRVDLPTFGRPQMAKIGRLAAVASSPPPLPAVFDRARSRLVLCAFNVVFFPSAKDTASLYYRNEAPPTHPQCHPLPNSRPVCP